MSVALLADGASARIDDAVEEVASYRTWTKVTKEPIKGASSIDLLTVDPGVAGG